MVDLETLGVGRDAPILTLAAVIFDPFGSTSGETFYRKIDPKCYDKYPYDFKINYSTLMWWLEQRTAPRDEAFSGKEDIKTVMIDFVQWLKPLGRLHMWSHGKEFDLPILESAMTVFDLTVPWKFWDTRDTRTLYHLANVILPKPSETDLDLHHAVGDCQRQIKGVQEAYRKLSI